MMKTDSILKTVGGVLLILAVVLYNHYRPGGLLPTPTPPPDVSAKTPESAPRESQPPPSEKSHEAQAVPKRDLDQDERRHGHTLQRHVGRTDQQLLERLRSETNIGSASTYTDKETAERCVGAALGRNKSRIDAWLRQNSGRENLAVNYVGDGKTPIGRSIHHGSTLSVPCYNAIVILKAEGTGFYVLTSYPETR